MQFLILIDGPKGAGKTTVSALLKERLKDVEFLSLDKEREALTDRTDSLSADNKRASHIVTEKLVAALALGKNVFIDTGLTEERMQIFEQIAQEHNVMCYKFALTAPYEVLCARVKARSEAKGSRFDQERFDVTYKLQQSKSFAGFKIIDSSQSSPEEIADSIVKTINLNLQANS